MMKHRYLFAAYAIVCGFICWAPGIALHFIARKSFFGAEVIVITISMPILAVFLSHYGKKYLPSKYSNFSPLFILFGIWFLGPSATMIGATASGGGLTSIETIKMIPLFTLVFPISTWMMSTYDGSLGGIIITTICLTVSFLRHRKIERKIPVEENAQQFN